MHFFTRASACHVPRWMKRGTAAPRRGHPRAHTHHAVLRLDVPVAEAVGVHEHQRPKQLREVEGRLQRRQGHGRVALFPPFHCLLPAPSTAYHDGCRLCVLAAGACGPAHAALPNAHAGIAIVAFVAAEPSPAKLASGYLCYTDGCPLRQ